MATTAKFRNSVSFLSLRENGIKWVNVRLNEDKSKYTAYFYGNKEDLENHEHIITHCYCTEKAFDALSAGDKNVVYLVDCSQDEGKTWVPLLCVGDGQVTGTKGKSVLTIEL